MPASRPPPSSRGSPRRDKPFVSVNCAALPENLVETELFGHEKGAFTGAHAARPGHIEMAHGGTLFLDEIGTLPLALQSKLLRVLEDREVQRIGAKTARKIDFRLITATNETLEDMVSHVEKLVQSLELPYRILRLCGGDMSFTSALTYDFEVYSAAQDKWLEVSSVSNFETFQTNRMKIRFKDKAGRSQLAHSLNGSSLALPRILACLLENNQTADGVILPDVLSSYFGNAKIN